MEGPILVTGATGFFGRHLLARLGDLAPDAEVWATGVGPGRPHQAVHRFEVLDLSDRTRVEEFIDRCRPATVFHLAGSVAGGDLQGHLAVNVVGTANLCRSLTDLPGYRDLRMVQVGSAAMYGWVEERDLPVQESQALRPLSEYGISKAAQDLVAGSFQRRNGLPVVRARVFNVLGPGQPQNVVPGAFVAQLREMTASGIRALRVGNLDTRRDFLDIRDACKALTELAVHGTPGQAYNVASGVGVSIRNVLVELMEVSGIEAKVEEEAARLRPADVPVVVADIQCLRAAIDWQPEIGLRRSLADMWHSACSEDG